jgi:methylated-DNA-[protein]-cysteine S-methyltransferase
MEDTKQDARLRRLIACADEELDAGALEALWRDTARRVQESLDVIGRPPATVGITDSPLGRLLVARSERGIVLIEFLKDDGAIAPALAKLRRAFDPVEDATAAAEVSAEITRYLEGDGAALRQSVDLTLADEGFAKRVLNALMAVPRGALISYIALGAAAGAAHSARAVGGAMHRNPVPVYVPCHRVIAADGGLGGYGGGPSRKLKLLRAEGFALDEAAKPRLSGAAVWAHRRTGVYCRMDCRAALRADRARMLFFADAARAEQAGMRPCKRCRPA